MVNSDELLYVVNEFDMPLAPKPRHHVFKKGLWRRTAHVWIVNDNLEIFCQKRSLKKDISPGKWEPAVQGHLGPEDNYFTGAAREVFEETGVAIDITKLKLLKIYKDDDKREYRGVFYCHINLEPHKIKKEEDEVADVKLIKMTTLKRYLVYQKPDNWIYHGYERELFSKLVSLVN